METFTVGNGPIFHDRVRDHPVCGLWIYFIDEPNVGNIFLEQKKVGTIYN